ncbi:MAG: terminase family protein [Wenzhouxiangella sp.]|nr:terminase family protein [Wenzhouxiangella sp.]
MLSARQVGKSTIIAVRACHKAIYEPNSLILIVSPSQQQSRELMIKIEDVLSMDGTAKLETDAHFEKVFANGSRIVALPGTERSTRGYSNPALIIIDEAARVLDETYKSLRPMMVGGTTDLILLTTPFGRRGFFHRIWADESRTRWTKIEVASGWTLKGGELITPEPEKVYQKRRLKVGVKAFYSPRHTERFMLEELEEMDDPAWFNQEYGVEFVDPEGGLFDMEAVLASMDDSAPAIEINEIGEAQVMEL